MLLLTMYYFPQQGAGDPGVILGAEGDRVVLLIMYCFLQQGAGDLGVILGAEGDRVVVAEIYAGGALHKYG